MAPKGLYVARADGYWWTGTTRGPSITGGLPEFVMDQTKPSAFNTGLSVEGIDPSTLTVHNGNLIVTDSNVTITGLLVRGLVDLRGNNITFKNCMVASRNITSFTWDALVRSSGTGNIIENCELTQYDPLLHQDNSIWYIVGAKSTGGSLTVKRCNIHDVNDATYVTAGTMEVAGCYLHDFGFRTDDGDQSGSNPPGWSHNDGAQLMGGSGHHVHGSTFDMRFSTLTGMGSTVGDNPAAPGEPYLPNCHGVLLQGYQSQVTGVTVEYNWFSYGSVCIRGAGKNYSGNTATIRGNRFTPNQAREFNQYRQIVNDPADDWTLTLEGNVYSNDSDTPAEWRGQPIKAPVTAGNVTFWAFNNTAHTP